MLLGKQATRAAEVFIDEGKQRSVRADVVGMCGDCEFLKVYVADNGPSRKPKPKAAALFMAMATAEFGSIAEVIEGQESELAISVAEAIGKDFTPPHRASQPASTNHSSDSWYETWLPAVDGVGSNRPRFRGE